MSPMQDDVAGTAPLLEVCSLLHTMHTLYSIILL